LERLKVGTRKRPWEVLSEGKAAARGGDRTAEFFGGFDPFLNDDFYVGESFLVGLSVVGAAGKFGDFGDKRFAGLTPRDDDLLSSHRLLPPSGS
jgi:hypothetical protein